MGSPTIVVIGSANIDLVTQVPRMPKPGESLMGTSFATVTGGKGANQAIAVARLGGTVSFVGCVGNDPFGHMQRESLCEAGVDVSQLRLHNTEPTGTAVILVQDDGQNAIVVTPAANFALAPVDIQRARPLIAAADAVLLQLEIPMITVDAVLDVARECGVFTVLDAGPAQPVPADILRKADLVSPNETEAEALTGAPVVELADAEAAAQQLRDWGVAEVVLKLGARGALYLGAEKIFAPAFAVQAIDTTAAGDAFTAALALHWRTMGPDAALRFANAAGALAATVVGAQPAMPRRAAVQRFLQEHANR